MNVDATQFKYATYCRKSSDKEDRQVQSIATQHRELQAVIDRLALRVAAAWDEERSAFVPGRSAFGELVAATLKGRVNAWLVWHPSRLARNPVDYGTIIHLMDIEALHHVRTPTQTYFNTPSDKMQLGLEFMMSKKDSDDKSAWVRDGIRTKATKGVPHGVAKIGYANSRDHNKGDGFWRADPENFPKIQALFARFLSGACSVRELHAIARDELRLRTPVRKQSGGRPVTLAYLYRMLADPIYAGFFHYKGTRYALDERLPRAVSEEQYWLIQAMLGRKGQPRPRRHEALYNRFMRDAEGGGVTPDFKYQLICPACRLKFAYRQAERCPKCTLEIKRMRKPTYLSYVYYYSTREKKTAGCRTRGIEEKKIDAELVAYVGDRLAIARELASWCTEQIRLIEQRERRDAGAFARTLKSAAQEIENKLERLLDLRLGKPALTNEEVALFDRKEKALRRELAYLKAKKECGDEPDGWVSEVEAGLNLLPNLVSIVETGSLEEKRAALEKIGSNLTLIDGNVRIRAAKWVEVLIKGLDEAKRENPRFEPENTVDTSGSNPVFASVRPILRGAIENVRTCYQRQVFNEVDSGGDAAAA